MGVGRGCWAWLGRFLGTLDFFVLSMYRYTLHLYWCESPIAIAEINLCVSCWKLHLTDI